MIERHWKGIVKNQEAYNYIRHLQTETFPQIERIKGFVRATILQRTVDTGVEFVVVTVWESMAAIREFAGQEAAIAVVPPAARQMMVTFDRGVAHYEVRFRTAGVSETDTA